MPVGAIAAESLVYLFLLLLAILPTYRSTGEGVNVPLAVGLALALLPSLAFPFARMAELSLAYRRSCQSEALGGPIRMRERASVVLADAMKGCLPLAPLGRQAVKSAALKGLFGYLYIGFMLFYGCKFAWRALTPFIQVDEQGLTLRGYQRVRWDELADVGFRARRDYIFGIQVTTLGELELILPPASSNPTVSLWLAEPVLNDGGEPVHRINLSRLTPDPHRLARRICALRESSWPASDRTPGLWRQTGERREKPASTPPFGAGTGAGMAS